MSLFLFMLGALFVVIGVIWWRHRTQLAKHQGINRIQFVEHFRCLGIAEVVSGAVYDHFALMPGVSGFQPAPTDSFEGTFKMTGEDLDDELEELLRKFGWEMPHSGVLKNWDGRLETLSEVVRWVDWIRTKQNPSVAGQ